MPGQNVPPSNYRRDDDDGDSRGAGVALGLGVLTLVLGIIPFLVVPACAVGALTVILGSINAIARHGRTRIVALIAIVLGLAGAGLSIFVAIQFVDLLNTPRPR